MKPTSLLLFLSILCFQCQEKTINCTIETDMGLIRMELYPESAPITVDNFLRYVDAGLYKESSFFRTCTPQNEAAREVKIEVIQGGNIPETDELPPIIIETTKQTGLLHKDGTISMARDQPNSATCSFFICIGDQPALDFDGARNPDGYGFAAFGRVVEGKDVVRNIQAQEETEQYLVNPIRIVDIKRID